MGATVLLRGPLTKSKLENAWREVVVYQEPAKGGPQSITLVIASEGGGHRAFEFVRKMAKSGIVFSTKIYQAKSGAALIAMAAKRREMERGGVFEIHMGSATIESNEINAEGKVSDRILSFLEDGREKTLSLMVQCGFQETGPHMDTLFAQNRLTLTAEECLRLGIVERII